MEELLMKKIAMMVLCVMMAGALASGCAKKSASEQLQDDMNKAGKQMQKDMSKF